MADCIRTLRRARRARDRARRGLRDGAAPATTEAAAALLRSTRPTAVNLGWAIDRALAARRSARAGRASCTGAARRADRRLARARRGALRARATARSRTATPARSPPAGSAPAGGVLRAAWERGRLAQVWVDETRPLLQGARLTAWELGRAGIPLRVVADSSRGRADGARARRPRSSSAPTGSPPTATSRTRSAPTRSPCWRRATASRSTSPRRSRRSTRPRPTAPRSRSRSATRPRSPAAADAFNPAFDVTPAELVTRDLHRGRRARAALRGGDRACRCGLRSSPRRARCSGSAWSPARRAT